MTGRTGNQKPSPEQKQVATGKDSIRGFSERFTLMVLEEFGSGAGEVALTKSQKRLAQNYFFALDTVLRNAEIKRQKKSEDYRDDLPVTWAAVDMQILARNVVAAARIGWDALEKNHVHLVPYKNNNNNTYDIVFIPGYVGLEIKGKKYALDCPDVVIIKLIHANDDFTAIFKDADNSVESFKLQTKNPFDRGEVIGGFYYYEWKDHPEKNQLVIFSIKDIEKRKPRYASTEFWGGEKDKWVKDQKTGKNKKVGKEKVEGWYEDMCLKTLKRAAWGKLPIDSEKIDTAYQALKQNEASFDASTFDKEIDENANQGDNIDLEPDDTSEEQTGPVVDAEYEEIKEEEQINTTTGEIEKEEKEKKKEQEGAGDPGQKKTGDSDITQSQLEMKVASFKAEIDKFSNIDRLNTWKEKHAKRIARELPDENYQLEVIAYCNDRIDLLKEAEEQNKDQGGVEEKKKGPERQPLFK